MPASRTNASSIKNKMKREEVYQKQKRAKVQEKLRKRLALVEAERKDPEAKKRRLETNVPKTLDNMREYDPSMLTANPRTVPSTSTSIIPTENGNSTDPHNPPTIDEEYDLDISMDAFGSYFSNDPVAVDTPPKVLITTSSRATKVAFDFCEELVSVIPGAEFVRRKKNKGFEIGKITGWATGRGYTTLVVVNEDRKAANAITIIHLPSGPTAYFKLTSVQLTKEISGHARATPHYPELVLNGFVTRLGHVVGRMFQTLFPQLPEFEGRQVVTLHNQRDFLFFRRHRYVFASADRARLQEIGPRFTLKLRYIKKGTPAVHQLGAQPPRLQFDAEADEAEEGNESSADDPKRSQSDEGVLSSGEEDASSSALGSTPKASSSLTKDEEYIWKWKPKLETSRKTFFL